MIYERLRYGHLHAAGRRGQFTKNPMPGYIAGQLYYTAPSACKATKLAAALALGFVFPDAQNHCPAIGGRLASLTQRTDGTA